MEWVRAFLEKLIKVELGEDAGDGGDDADELPTAQNEKENEKPKTKTAGTNQYLYRNQKQN